MLTMYLSYLDEDGKPLEGLKSADIQLSVDAVSMGTPKTLTQFAATKEPISVVVVCQTAGGLDGPLLAEVKTGLLQLALSIVGITGSTMGILGYGRSTQRLLEAGSGLEIASAIRELKVDSAVPELHMLDTLLTAIDLLKLQPASRRKLIVLISDGSDLSTDSKAFSAVGNCAQEAGIVIDSIGYNQTDANKLSTLLQITKRSYGTARVVNSAPELSAGLGLIVEEIQKQYVVTYRLNAVKPGTEISTQLNVEPGGRPVYSNVMNVQLPGVASRKK
jgi:hypothetical protein